LDKKGKVSERILPATSTATHQRLPQMSSSQITPAASRFGNPPRAVYQRSSRKITRAIATNPPFVNSDPTTPYPTPDQAIVAAQ